MIVIDSVKGNSGQGVPMFSRAGKSTINQYLAFAPKSDQNFSKVQHEEDKDDSLDDDVNRELQIMLQREEELKKVYFNQYFLEFYIL